MAGMTDVAKLAGVKIETVKAVFEAVGTLAASEIVSCRGFGAFKTKLRVEKKGRNPKTGEELTIPAKSVLTFKAAK